MPRVTRHPSCAPHTHPTMPKSPRKPCSPLTPVRRPLTALILVFPLVVLFLSPGAPDIPSNDADVPPTLLEPLSVARPRSSQSHSTDDSIVPRLVRPVSVSSSRRYCDKHNDTDDAPCIFDIGMNTGQDSRLYLRSWPNSRVVAVEADPTLVAEAKHKFKLELQSGRLKLLNIGLVGNATLSREERPKLTFWLNTHSNKYSSFTQVSGCRTPKNEYPKDGSTEFCRRIDMDTMSCSELIEEYGTPIYMKIDIEDMDRACVQALGNIPEEDRPKYISKENIHENGINILSELGYDRFKVVSQAALQVGLSREEKGTSGPWGEDAEDIWIGKKWHTREELLDRLPAPSTFVVNGFTKKAWYDLHATKV